VRQGLGNSITQDETAANTSLRASVAIQLSVRAEGIAAAVPDTVLGTNAVRLYGPGDVLGIDPRAVVKTEPRHWITNYEPNNLAHVEFYDEDFPWRYTPARASTTTHRHRPWIALVVLGEGEFTDGNAAGRPSPFIDVTDLSLLPAREELWAWAHVQVNRNLGPDASAIVNSDGAAIAGRLRAVLAENPDLACSRIVCPRKLEPNTAYHAFLLPTFETGRVAGLGLDVGKVDDAMRGAWEDHPERANLAGSSFRITTAGSSAPGSRVTSSTSCVCSSPRRWTRGWAGGTSTCSGQGATSTGSPAPTAMACCGWAARSGCRPSRSPRNSGPRRSGSRTGPSRRPTPSRAISPPSSTCPMITPS
jgi:hypothetical protein